MSTASPTASRIRASAAGVSGALREFESASFASSSLTGRPKASVAGGSSRSSGSFSSRSMASTRYPAAPRSIQNASTSCIAAITSGLRQSRSGCSG